MADPARVIVPFEDVNSRDKATPVRRRLRQFRALVVEAPVEVRIQTTVPRAEPQIVEPLVESPIRDDVQEQQHEGPKALKGLRATRLERTAQTEMSEVDQEAQMALMTHMQDSFRAEMENRIAEVLELQIPIETKFSLIAWLGDFLASVFLLIPPPEEQFRLFMDARSGIKVRPATPPSGE